MKKRERNSFLTPLVVEVMPSGKRFKLHHEFTYHWGVARITVPVGFETDFASIPRIFRIIIPKLGRWNKAAVLHDYAYQTQTMTRKQADDLFRDSMKGLGVLAWKINIMYWAVRIGGWMAWRGRK